MWFVCYDKETDEVRRVIKLATLEKAMAIQKYRVEEIQESQVAAYQAQVVEEKIVVEEKPTLEDRIKALETKMAEVDVKVEAMEKEEKP